MNNNKFFKSGSGSNFGSWGNFYKKDKTSITNSNGEVSPEAVEQLASQVRTQESILVNKVNKESGKGLSDENYSTTEKAKLTGLPSANQLSDDFDKKVDKESGKGLSDENYSATEKSKLGALPSASQLTSDLNKKVNAVLGQGLSEENFTEDLKNKLTDLEVEKLISGTEETGINIVDSDIFEIHKSGFYYANRGARNTPEDQPGFFVLEVLSERDKYITFVNHTNEATFIVQQIEGQWTDWIEDVFFTPNLKHKLDELPTGSRLQSDLDQKVDKESGKGLSERDFTSAHKTKLEDIPNQLAVTNVDNDFSSNQTFKGRVIAENGYPRVDLNDTDAGHNDWSIINAHGEFRLYDAQATDNRMKIDTDGDVSFSEHVQAKSFKVEGGNAQGFLKGDGSIDQNAYVEEELGKGLSTNDLTDQLLLDTQQGVNGLDNMTTLEPKDARLYLAGKENKGALKIKLPQGFTNTMIRMNVEVFDYSLNGSFKIEVSGYTYVGSEEWIRTSAQIISNNEIHDLPIRFGHEGGKCCVYIGDVDTNWSYPHIYLSKVSMAFGAYQSSNWISGWDLSLETGSFNGISAEHHNNLVNKFNNSYKAKLDGIEDNANKYVHPSTHSISEISGLEAALDGKRDKPEQENLHLSIGDSGWYTIATCSNGRAMARFGLKDTASGRHQTCIFYASHLYGDGNSINVIANALRYHNPIERIRIKDKSSTDGAALQIYLNADTKPCTLGVFLLDDNIQYHGWKLTDIDKDSETPEGISASEWGNYQVSGEVDLLIGNGSTNTTGDIYAKNEKLIAENTVTSLLSDKVDKEVGKGLSTNDFTNTAKSKLDGVEDNANKYVHPSAHSMSEVSGLNSALNDKVDKVNGKGLSENDLTDELKERLEQSVTDGFGVTTLQPLDAKLSLTERHEGAIKITLPQGYSATMMKLEVDIFDYIENKSIKILISGYNYSHHQDWRNTSVQILANKDHLNYPVRFGSEEDKCCIYIGELDSVWMYPKVVVSKGIFSQSNHAYDNWISGWRISIDDSGFQNVTKQHTDNLLQNISDAEVAKLGGIEPNANKYVHPSTHSMNEVSGLNSALNDKVDKENGKGLSTNDFTNADKDKLDHHHHDHLYYNKYQKTITVDGEADKYYPVVFKNGNQDIPRDLLIYRSYTEVGPSTWNTATHKAGLTALFSVNFGGWGGSEYKWKLLEYRKNYAFTLGGAKFTNHYKGFTVFLRGGGAKYHVRSNQTLDIQVAYSSSEITYPHTTPSKVVYADEPLTTPMFSDLEDHMLPTNKEVDDKLESKVDQESGKGLSTNDFTNADKDKLEASIFKQANGNVGIGTDSPNKKLHVKGGQLRVESPYGYSDIGAFNADWFHFSSDRPGFYFNKQTHVNGDLRVYGKNTLLRYSDGAIIQNGKKVATEEQVNLKVDKVNGKGLSENDLTDQLLLETQQNVNNTDGMVTLVPKDARLQFRTDQNRGALKIKLPQDFTSTMIKMDVEVYNYRLNGSFKVEISGYTYADSRRWFQTSAQIIANKEDHDLPVRFGHEDGKCCVYIGELDTNWAYPHIYVSKISMGAGAYAPSDWMTGWDLSLETNSFRDITAEHHDNMVNKFNNTYKSKLDGIATGANKYIHPSTHSMSEVSGLTSALSGKENSFTKNSAFNKNFGTTSGTVMQGNDSRVSNGQTAYTWGNHATANYVQKDASGNLGIGTDNPTMKLDISDLGEYDGINIGNHLKLRTSSSASDSFVIEHLKQNGNLYIRSQAITGQNTHLALNDNGGNVGIGASAPVQKLHVNGGKARFQTSYGYVDLGAENANWYHIKTDRAKFYLNKQTQIDGDIKVYGTNTYMRKSDGAIIENGLRVSTQDYVNQKEQSLQTRIGDVENNADRNRITRLVVDRDRDELQIHSNAGDILAGIPLEDLRREILS